MGDKISVEKREELARIFNEAYDCHLECGCGDCKYLDESNRNGIECSAYRMADEFLADNDLLDRLKEVINDENDHD